MQIPYHQLPQNAKVWIYQANRNFTAEEVAEVSLLIDKFVESWQSHQANVPAYGALYYRRFVVLMADTEQVNVSGCSIDSSVKLIKEIEINFGINFFDRMKVCYKIQEQLVGSFPLQDIESLLVAGKIDENTIVFNNLVADKNTFEQEWELPLKNSLFSRYIAKV